MAGLLACANVPGNLGRFLTKPARVVMLAARQPGICVCGGNRQEQQQLHFPFGQRAAWRSSEASGSGLVRENKGSAENGGLEKGKRDLLSPRQMSHQSQSPGCSLAGLNTSIINFNNL